jgi:hypothetical protein
MKRKQRSNRTRRSLKRLLRDRGQKRTFYKGGERKDG